MFQYVVWGTALPEGMYFLRRYSSFSRMTIKMSTLQRNDLCHCGSGKKYKHCCMNKDKAQEVLAQQKYDVRREIRPNTTPYMFWKTWSAACRKQAVSLVRDLLMPESALRERFNNSDEAFVTLSRELGLPYEPAWTLDKIKLSETGCMFLCHLDTDDKNADNVVSLVTLKRTNLGLRVENVQKVIQAASPDFLLSFDLFGVQSAEHDYLVRCRSGWKRPDLTDASSRYVAAD